MSPTKKILSACVLVGILFLLNRCTSTHPVKVTVDIHAKPYESLSEYHFFSGNLRDLTPNEGVLPYDLNSALFTDYAEKARFVWMPKGSTARFTPAEVLDFPEGAVLIKNFYYRHDEGDPGKGNRIIETRLLIKYPDAWKAFAYIWNKEQTEATLSVTGGVQAVEWTNGQGQIQKISYIVPNQNQCKGCHDYDGKLTPIGPKVRNLNKDYAYPEGTANQLDKWVSAGYLDGIASYDSLFLLKVAQWDKPSSGTLHERAMAYLDINCGHCHNPHGPANTSGLNLTADEKMGAALGIYKAPVSTGKGSGGHQYSIVPGHPEKSILVYRMESTDPGAMMPELGRRMVHKEGVALMRQWIGAMKQN